MKRITIKLPWPPSGLSPNAREHWAGKARLAKKYRATCGKEAIAWGVNRLKPDRVFAHVEFYPPDKRKRDDDNMIASFKSGRDGVADVLGIDDAEWTTSYTVHRDVGGYVIVTISDQAPDARVQVVGKIGG